MQIKPFAVEEWMNAYETRARYNIAETCVDSISLDALFELCGVNREAFLEPLCRRRLTYGDIEGLPALREGLCSLYRTIRPEQVVTCHGAAGANHHVFYSLVEPGDRVISVMPTYQQLYSIPEGYGAEVKVLPLRKENGYLPDLEELRKLAVPGTKLICINNPNNPTGVLMGKEMLEEIAAIAQSVGAYLLCDEVYRHLSQEETWCESVADLYEKGISVGSMSKVFALAGLRLGWIATRDRSAMQAFLSHRDYNHISCGILDEAVAALALSHAEALLARNRRIVRENLKILSAYMQTEKRLDWHRPEAGTTALIGYDYDIASWEFCRELLEQTGALLTPGACFEVEKSFRIGYAANQKELKDGLSALSSYLRSLEARGL